MIIYQLNLIIKDCISANEKYEFSSHSFVFKAQVRKLSEAYRNAYFIACLFYFFFYQEVNVDFMETKQSLQICPPRGFKLHLGTFH